MKAPIIILLVLTMACTSSPSEMELILNQGSEEFQSILKSPKHEVQIIYGKVTPDSIRHLSYNVDPELFFYPASTVKMPVAFAAAKRLQDMGMPLSTEIRVDSSELHPRRLQYDSLFMGPITVENLIKKIFVFSDNQAYNILYNWLGKDYINLLNDSLGLESRIIHQLSESAFSFSNESNAFTTNVELISGGSTESLNLGTALDEFGELQTWQPENNPFWQIKGKAYINGDGKLVEDPFDFSEKNFVLLSSSLGFLERVIKPELFETGYDFNSETQSQLLDIMALRPRMLPHPMDTLPDNYVKFFLYGDSKELTYPESVEIRNKVGWAYGYLSDIAHIKDTENNIEFFLAASILVNENQTYNDGIYEYEEIGLPFLRELGQIFYQHELENAN